MAAQVNLFCLLMFFSVWLAIWCLKISTIVLIKVVLTTCFYFCFEVQDSKTKKTLKKFHGPQANPLSLRKLSEHIYMQLHGCDDKFYLLRYAMTRRYCRANTIYPGKELQDEIKSTTFAVQQK